MAQALERVRQALATPKVGAVCGKAERTVLRGGRAMKRTSLPLYRRELQDVIYALASSAVALIVLGAALQCGSDALIMPNRQIEGKYHGRCANFRGIRCELA